MIIKIVCAGNDNFSQLYSHDEGEYLIGVDGGAKVILKNRLNIDLAIGDFDSSSVNVIRKKSKAILIYPPHKDKSDLELALKHISSKEFKVDYIANKVIEDIIIYNATGKRLDHYQSIINLLIQYTHLPIKIIDKNNLIQIVNSNTNFQKNEYKYISFFAVDPNTIITLTGFVYPLNKHPLKVYDSLGLSNEIEEDYGRMETNNKKILVIQSN
jgi:thiamine pyrophosphokinase